MMVLALDTAGEACAAALVVAETEPVVLAQRSESIGRGHAERLMPMIGDVLSQTGKTFADIDRVAVTTGPGSFTGTRIGVAAARGLALALDIPAVGVSVLEALIETAAVQGGLAAAALDARRGEIYGQAAWVGENARPGIEASVTPAAAFAEAIAALAPEAIAVTGSAAMEVARLLAAQGVPARVTQTRGVADIVTVARIGARRETGPSPRPLYLRPPDAKPQGAKAVTRR